MSWKSGNIGSGVNLKSITKTVNYVVNIVDCVFNKRLYINIIVILLSIGLVSGYYCSINDKEYWNNTYKTVTKNTTDKVLLMGTSFATKTQNKFNTSIHQAYGNSKNAINKKLFHQMPKVHIRSGTSVIGIFTNKSFNTIKDSKKLRLGELKWKLFSKIQ